MSFSSLGLSESLVQAVADQKYTQPFPIQKQAIPALLKGKDLLGISKTGSGKTAGYVLPILELFQKSITKNDRHIRALVLVPTRELAVQVDEVFKLFGAKLPQRLKTMAVFGGVSINPQMMSLHGTDILIATPGRLLDLVDSKAVHLSEVEILVLDEADKMLNLGFRDEMTHILSLLPQKRQNILLSATLSPAVTAIQKTFLHEPVIIEIEEEESNIDLIEQVAYRVSPDGKGPLLRQLIKSEDMQQVLVFTSAIRAADNLVGKLLKNNIEAAAFHSQLSQSARTVNLHKFKTGRIKVLVATDLASRGIDIHFLPYVINYELPRSPKDYIHRIGRTGRAEAPGKAISLITPEEEHHFGIIQKKMGKKVEMLDAQI
ncbi:DEAD/DEAH box helicase [Chitinophagaceae bacterium LWZ2-11]